MKTFYQLNNMGQARYSVSFHDGVKQHNDKSPFYDIRLFSNKAKLAGFIESLKAQGYIEHA